jgi:threonine dehydratase
MLFLLFSLLACSQTSYAKGCFENLAALHSSHRVKTHDLDAIAKSQIEDAAERIYRSGLVKKTSLVKSEALSRRFGTNVYLKQDYKQNIGAFKIRGAANSLLSLVQSKGSVNGVVTASSGNHAQGIALTARELKIPATIVMAENASSLKIEKVRKLGAEVVLHGNSFEEAEAFAKSFAKNKQYNFIHPFANEHVMAGQGTMGLEIVEQMSELAPRTHNDLLVVAPIGGGGLMAGVSSYLKADSSSIQTLGVQASANSFMAQAVLNRTDFLSKSTSVSFADGAAVTMVDDRIKYILSKNLDYVASVEEREIIQALLDLEAEGVYVEGAAALSLAGLNQLARDHANNLPENVVLVLTGKNLDPVKRQAAIESLN